MNEMRGFGLQERLAVPLIYMTAHDDTPTRERIEKSGTVGPILIFLEVALNTADPQKRIDHYIDYFGGGGSVRRSVVSPDPCGESLLDAGRAHRARRVLIS
jgi:hypothetical protein